uniref:Uncharacterized protein n=1 Tax=Vespula pensylvanica TaxID=30213 RepID=A0A834P427_VESPE|nr:hypothetical protein H0235_007013 [Vespula pensylvanica]
MHRIAIQKGSTPFARQNLSSFRAGIALVAFRVISNGVVRLWKMDTSSMGGVGCRIIKRGSNKYRKKALFSKSDCYPSQWT